MLFPYSPGKQELAGRLERLFAALHKRIPDWETALVTSPVNLYYLTGTMQEGALVLKKSGAARYFVRKSYARALEESAFPDIAPMHSYTQVAEAFGPACGVTVLEKEQLTLKMLERLQNHLQLGRLRSLEPVMAGLRALKSPFELAIMKECGALHARFYDEIIPEMLREGMSEHEFSVALFARACEIGHSGATRFMSPFMPPSSGQVNFGDNALCPSPLDAPGGMRGQYPAAPGYGDRNRFLHKGDLVGVDYGFSLGGYHSDRTQIYLFGEEPDRELLDNQARCRDICLRAAAMLKPGMTPEAIYKAVMPGPEDPFTPNFMGMGKDAVHFLGHSIGLAVDEMPVIAKGFTEPLQEGMVLAIEPKKGLPGRGFVATEDTYLVSPEGGISVTGGTGYIRVV